MTKVNLVSALIVACGLGLANHLWHHHKYARLKLKVLQIEGRSLKVENHYLKNIMSLEKYKLRLAFERKGRKYVDKQGYFAWKTGKRPGAKTLKRRPGSVQLFVSHN